MAGRYGMIREDLPAVVRRNGQKCVWLFHLSERRQTNCLVRLNRGLRMLHFGEEKFVVDPISHWVVPAKNDHALHLQTGMLWTSLIFMPMDDCL